MKKIFFVMAMLIATAGFCQTDKDLSKPKEFVLHLIQLSQDGDKAAWAGILSEKIKERHKDDTGTHFTAWSAYFTALAKKYAGKLDELKITCNEKATEIRIEGEFEMRVVKENGQFKINEN